jgi:hypothetical protein
VRYKEGAYTLPRGGFRGNFNPGNMVPLEQSGGCFKFNEEGVDAQLCNRGTGSCETTAKTAEVQTEQMDGGIPRIGGRLGGQRIAYRANTKVQID